MQRPIMIRDTIQVVDEWGSSLCSGLNIMLVHLFRRQWWRDVLRQIQIREWESDGRV
jgi:hypothetical protein